MIKLLHRRPAGDFNAMLTDIAGTDSRHFYFHIFFSLSSLLGGTFRVESLFLYLLLSLSTCLFIQQFAFCLFYKLIRLFIFISILVFIYLTVYGHLFARSSVYISIRLSVYECICSLRITNDIRNSYLSN